MAIDRGAINARVREVNDAIGLLRELAEKDFAQLSLHERLSMRYLVIQLVEAAAAICLHILSRSYGERAEGYPDCFTRLAAKGVIDGELGERLARAARLRNLLVHRYWDIDDAKVHESVKGRLGDFEDFVREVVAYAERGG